MLLKRVSAPSFFLPLSTLFYIIITIFRISFEPIFSLRVLLTSRMTVTTPTADEVVKFVLANRPQQPSAKNIKYDVQEQQSVPCSHNKEIVNGRWGCLDCYKEIREKEDVLFKEMTEEDRDAQLKEKLEHNKHCWEQLGDRNPGGKRSNCCPRVIA